MSWTSRGIGGSSSYFVEPAILAFADKPQTRLYELELLIAEPHESNEGLPSLLGRDVVNHWYMQYDPTHSRLECTVRYADHTLGAPDGAAYFLVRVLQATLSTSGTRRLDP